MRHLVNKVKTLGRPKGARVALYKGLIRSFIEKGSIQTTVAKAKSLRPQIEHLVSIAKKENLASFRYLIGKIGSKQVAKKLYKEVAPVFKGINGGYVTIKKTGIRVGDGAHLAKLSWSINLEKDKKTTTAEPTEAKKDLESSSKKVLKEKVIKKEVKTKKVAKKVEVAGKKIKKAPKKVKVEKK